MKQHHSIWTPELVELSLPLAGITRRVLARLIDQLILVGAYAAIVFGGLFCVGAFAASEAEPTLAIAIMCFCFLLIFTVDFLYYWGFHALTGGQTPGKMLLGIRVVTARGGRINMVTALMRSLFNFIDSLLFWGSLSAMMIIATDQEKRIADYAAGTIVVVDN